MDELIARFAAEDKGDAVKFSKVVEFLLLCKRSGYSLDAVTLQVALVGAGVRDHHVADNAISLIDGIVPKR